ncbi:MAG: molybdopterin molybdotransferase MoeA [Gammaproteobacteria bacterium]|nr:molybdopterin molybdotransferase MoeA [Gammaproteobacteria bacterium]
MNDTTRDPCAAPKGLLSVTEARQRIDALIAPIRGIEQLPIRSALGRILAAPVISTIDVPPYTNSAMDGYALRGADLPSSDSARLRVIGRAMAGTPFAGQINAGEAVRIMTGAAMPAGADTVLMQERVQVDGEHIVVSQGHKPGENVRQAGEDMAVGSTVLEPGKHLLPAELGVLASLGIAEVRVQRLLRVAFFSTGDELKSLGEPLEAGQIYDSNRYTLHGMLARLGVELLDLGVIRDDRDAIRRAFHDAAANADVVITSGGVSVGEADFVKQTLDELGRVDFWKIAMKPGKPLAFGKVGAAMFFGLPGNPVSVMATFYLFVQPALQKLMGMRATPSLTLRVPCAVTLKKDIGRTDFQRGILHTDAHGVLTVTTSGRQGSHVLTSMSKSNCFIVLPAESTGAQAGEWVEVLPFAGLI